MLGCSCGGFTLGLPVAYLRGFAVRKKAAADAAAEAAAEAVAETELEIGIEINIDI